MLGSTMLRPFAWALKTPAYPARAFFGRLSLGGGGWKVPAAHNSKTTHGIEMKFGRLVENHELLICCNLIGKWRHHYVIMTS